MSDELDKAGLEAAIAVILERRFAPVHILADLAIRAYLAVARVDSVIDGAFSDLVVEDMSFVRIGNAWMVECATEGCGDRAMVLFERGGVVGSHYCRACYMRIQAIGALPKEG